MDARVIQDERRTHTLTRRLSCGMPLYRGEMAQEAPASPSRRHTSPHPSVKVSATLSLSLLLSSPPASQDIHCVKAKSLDGRRVVPARVLYLYITYPSSSYKHQKLFDVMVVRTGWSQMSTGGIQYMIHKQTCMCTYSGLCAHTHAYTHMQAARDGYSGRTASK